MKKTAGCQFVKPLPGLILCGVLLVGCTFVAPDPAGYDQTVNAEHPLDEDELLVLDPPQDYVKHLADLGLEVLDVTDLHSIGSKLYHLKVIDGAHPFDARDRHSKRFPGIIIDAHHHYEHHAKRVDKTYTAQKAAKWVSQKKTCGRGLRIGVVDGIVDLKHQAFKGTKISYRSFHLKGEKPAGTDHGTAVTAVIVGKGSWGGMLPGAEIFAANVFHKNTKGKAIGSAKSIVRAIDWMVHNKVSVVNFSLGGGINALIAKAIEHASAKGMVLIASSGNGGPFSKKKSYPGAYPSVIAVTAVDQFERSARFASAGDYIDFAAPGVSIWTAVPKGGKAMSGTSFAAPIVAAYAAAAKVRQNISSVDEMRTYLRSHTRDHGKPGRDKYTGWGVVQLPGAC